MVSLNDIHDPINENVVQPAQPVEDNFGEQYFPEEMSWYSAEGPQGWIEMGARKVRENPWAAMGIALAAGVALALIARPLIRAGIEAACSCDESDATAEAASEKVAGESACCEHED